MRKNIAFIMRAFCIVGLVFLNVKAANIQESKWENGQTLLTFFEKNSIPLKVYYDLPREDKELADEIMSGNTYYTLYDGEILLQALIPISENSQLHIYKQGDNYGMRAIPIAYFKKEHSVAISVENSLYYDIIKYTGDHFLASDFLQAYKGGINFKKQIKKGDKLAIIYERKYRLGKVFGSPSIQASTLEVGNQKKYAVRYEDGYFYDMEGNSLTQYLFIVPLQYKRISSHFSMGRKHPILGYKRPHLGIDYAAPRHTPIKAASQGKIVFAGVKGGYGKTVIIQHENGYRTLYGHMHSINKGIKAGVYVSQGQRIGTVGSTGLSTGPHLHFGLYKNGSALNPQKHLSTATKKLDSKKRQEFLAFAKVYKEQLDIALVDNLKNEPFKKLQNSYIVYIPQENSIENEDPERNN